MSKPEDRQSGCQPPNCNDCACYFVTHDPAFRYGCRALDFKSQRLPMLDVAEASGQSCHYFRRKPRRTG